MLVSEGFMAAVPNLFGTRDQFQGRKFFHETWRERWFQDVSSTLHLLCTLFILLLHQIHLRSLGIRSQRLGTLVLWGWVIKGLHIID